MNTQVRCRVWALVAIFVVSLWSASAFQILDPPPRTPLPDLMIEDVEAALHGSVPLKGVSVDVQMIDALAKVSLTQVYTNPLDKPVRVSYVFPMDDRATITSFTADFSNGRKLVGTSKEATLARAEFEESVSSGHAGILLDQQSSESFRAEIGNLLARETVKITIEYATSVVAENSETFRFTLPTVLPPRYKPSTQEPPVSSTGVPYSLSFDMSVTMTTEIGDIASPTHEISTQLGSPRTAKIQTAGSLDGDFVIVVKTKKRHHTDSTIIVEQDPKQPDFTALYVGLNPSHFLLPDTADSHDPIELHFVVDVSGSMMGYKMRDTILAMKEAMTQLRESRRKILFNVLPFSTDFQTLFPTPQLLNDRTFNQAIEFIGKLQAVGGTELIYPLRHIFSSPLASEASHRRIIVLTDGLVGDTQEIFQLVSAHSKNTQVFSVGIGNGVSHTLVNGLAHHGLGVAEYVVLGEHVADKMRRHLARALSPKMVAIELVRYLGSDGVDISEIHQSPSVLPPIYSDSELRFFVMAQKMVDVLEVVLSDGRSIRVPMDSAQHVTSDLIHKMAAKSRLREIELALESDDMNVMTESVKKEMRQQIVSIATAYNLMSSQTSFVAVDPDSTTATAEKPVHLRVRGEQERGAFPASTARHARMASPLSAPVVGMALKRGLEEFATSLDVEGGQTPSDSLKTQSTDNVRAADAERDELKQASPNDADPTHHQPEYHRSITQVLKDVFNWFRQLFGFLFG